MDLEDLVRFLESYLYSTASAHEEPLAVEDLVVILCGILADEAGSSANKWPERPSR
jgi:hypothetical protein